MDQKNRRNKSQLASFMPCFACHYKERKHSKIQATKHEGAIASAAEFQSQESQKGPEGLLVCNATCKELRSHLSHPPNKEKAEQTDSQLLVLDPWVNWGHRMSHCSRHWRERRGQRITAMRNGSSGVGARAEPVRQEHLNSTWWIAGDWVWSCRTVKTPGASLRGAPPLFHEFYLQELY